MSQIHFTMLSSETNSEQKPPVFTKKGNVSSRFLITSVFLKMCLSKRKEMAPFYDVVILKTQGTPLPSPRHNGALDEEKKLKRSSKRDRERN